MMHVSDDGAFAALATRRRRFVARIAAAPPLVHTSAMKTSLAVTLLIAGVGCSGSSADVASTGSSAAASTAGTRACSPFDSVAQPIALAHVLGAGRHADGTLYVLDDGAPTYRAFVSQGNVLHRKEVTGSGTVGGEAGAVSITATVRDAAAPFALQIERSGDVATRMGVFRGDLQTKSFDVGQQGDVLELVGVDVLAGLQLQNLPGDVVTEYDATTEDGHRLVVTRPAADWTYESFRVFYGTPDQMKERHLTNASRGSTTYISFDLDGVEQTAIFPSKAFSASYEVPVLRTGVQGSQSLTVLPEGSTGAGLTFFCF
ncbi:MAG: hypothetical protein JWP87_2545 [Labilithrix sp.]|nr:hypothetical protein [Labilithrix sp.]